MGTPIRRAIQTIGMPSAGQRSLSRTDSLNSGSDRLFTRKFKLGVEIRKRRATGRGRVNPAQDRRHVERVDRQTEDAIDVARKMRSDLLSASKRSDPLTRCLTDAPISQASQTMGMPSARHRSLSNNVSRNSGSIRSVPGNQGWALKVKIGFDGQRQHQSDPGLPPCRARRSEALGCNKRSSKIIYGSVTTAHGETIISP